MESGPEAADMTIDEGRIALEGHQGVNEGAVALRWVRHRAESFGSHREVGRGHLGVGVLDDGVVAVPGDVDFIGRCHVGAFVRVDARTSHEAPGRPKGPTWQSRRQHSWRREANPAPTRVFADYGSGARFLEGFLRGRTTWPPSSRNTPSARWLN